jgi:tRNA (guanine37-N1)-methyltransferase
VDDVRIDVVTIFPEVFPGPLGVGVLGRARERGLVDLAVWDLRDFTADRHRSVDDIPYGGGVGMVMKAEPFVKAVDAIRAAHAGESATVVLTTPQGARFSQAKAQALAARAHLVVLCGRYEGVDERVVELLGADEISIGDYVLSGGELAAMVIIEAAVRLLPGAVGDAASVAQDSFSEGMLDYPQYTRPASFRGCAVPEVLLSGHHEAIRRWRTREALRRTLLRRPDLLDDATLDEETRAILGELRGT